jgi:hypothetical protein
VKKDERSPWHRDDLPAWAWVAIILMRIGQLAALLVPLALAVLLWWTWTHRRDPGVQRVLRGAAQQAGAVVDSARSVLR